MIAARYFTVFASGLSLLALAGCATAPKPEDRVAPVHAGDFVPASPVAMARLESGRYPNLLAPTSYALWVTGGVAAAKLKREQESGTKISEMLAADADVIASNYHIIELNMESMFPDASIALDVVGLRAIDTYLTLPDGTRVPPLQRLLGMTARESQEGALRRYDRTNILVFPKIDVLSGAPTLPEGSPGVRLTIDGFNSVFHFEWAAAPSPSGAAAAPREAGGLTWSGLYSRLRELARMTQ